MCTGFEIAAIVGAAASVAGTAASMDAANSQTKARNQAMAAEAERQSRLSRETEAINENSRRRVEGAAEEQTGEREQDLTDYFRRVSADTRRDPILPASTSEVTVQEGGRQNAIAQDFTDQQTGALAKLRSFGDVLGGINRGFQRDAGQVGMINRFKQASSGVLPFELERANQAGAGSRTLGDIFGAVGTGARGYATGGSFAGGAGSGTTVAPDAYMAANRGANVHTLYGAV